MRKDNYGSFKKKSNFGSASYTAFRDVKIKWQYNWVEKEISRKMEFEQMKIKKVSETDSLYDFISK